MSAPEARPRIGFFGTGTMGHPMAYCLMRAGYPMSVWNRTRAKYEDLVRDGASAPGTPKAVAEQSDVLIAMLMEPAHLDAILHGPDGILAGVHGNDIFIDMGTNPPRNAQRLERVFAQHGVVALDAPVRGGVKGAVDGSLLIMAGGDAATYERARPIFETLSATSIYVGPAGCGQLAKAAHQLVVAVTLQASAEALALAEAFGADQQRVRDVLLAGQAASPVLKRQGARMIERDWRPGRPIRHYLKDQANIQDALMGTALDLPVTATVFDRISAFVAAGNGELDESAVYTMLDSAEAT